MIYVSDVWSTFLVFGHLFGLLGIILCIALTFGALIGGAGREKLLSLLFLALIPVFALWYNAAIIEEDDYTQRSAITWEYIVNLDKNEKANNCGCKCADKD